MAQKIRQTVFYTFPSKGRCKIKVEFAKDVTLFKVIKINVGAEVVEILIDVTVSARISSIRRKRPTKENTWQK